MKCLNCVGLLLVITLSKLEINLGEEVKCPRYCNCYLDSEHNLRSVSCIARRLDSIDLAVPRRVQSLDLSNNSISILEDRGFQNLGLLELVKLVIKHNSIQTIGLHSFSGLPYLQWLDLTSNKLYQILPWTFYENSNLKFLGLSSNPLGHIISSGPLLDIPSLEILELSNCNFAYFSQEAFSELPNLRKLDISSNQLITVDIYTLQFLFSLEELDISNNPYPCDSNLVELEEFLESRSSSLLGSSCNRKLKTQDQPQKFEKMISIVQPEYDKISNSVDIAAESEGHDGVDSDLGAEKTQMPKKTECNKFVESSNNSFDSKDFILPPTLMAVIGFQLGVCTTLFFGYLWNHCTKQKRPYNLLQNPPLLTITPALTQPTVVSEGVEHQPILQIPETLYPPDTPPPSYSELFITFQ